MLEIKNKPGAVELRVRVQPRSSRDAVEGDGQGALRVRLTAPPVDDRANQALRRLLAARLNIPIAAVTILAGQRSRTKRVVLRGVSAAAVRALAASG